MIDYREEELLSMSEAARRLPGRSGRKPIHVATLYRWAGEGVQGIRLETVQLGGHRFTSAEALERFIRALTRLRDEQESGGGGWA